MAGREKVALYEWARILATFCVVIGHAHYLANSSALGGVDYPYPEQACPAFGLLWGFLREANGIVYCFHMPLFFLLSGAVLRLRPLDDLGTLLRKKAKRLLLPYYAVGLLYMFPLKWLGGYYPEKGSLGRAMGDFLVSTAESGHLWFLPALFWCMLLFALAAKGLARLPGPHGLLCLSACLLLHLLGRLAPQSLPDLLGLSLGLQYLPWFALGYVLEPLRPRFEALPACAAAPLALASFVLLLVARRRIWPAACKVLIGCACVFLAALLATRFPVRLRQGGVFQVLVRNLFAIYLYHDPLNYLLLCLFFRYSLYRSGACTLLYMLARTAGTAMVSVGIGEGVGALRRAAEKQITAKGPAGKAKV